MGAKVRQISGAWWVVTHFDGKRRKKRVGPTKADKREAEQIAKKINAALALGTFAPEAKAAKPLPCDGELRRWHRTYAPTLSTSFERESKRIIKDHLSPFYGDRDLREIGEEELLGYIGEKLEAGLAPNTILTHLSILRRVLSLAVRSGELARNPASGLGELMRRVARRAATEVASVDSWSREEVETLLELAVRHEPRFHAALFTLFSTGLRRGELLALKWEDVDFERRRLHVRRALVRGEITTPKSGRARFVAMPSPLAELLLDLLGKRRQQVLARGGGDVPEWVFPSETRGPLDERNFTRSWERVRRRAASTVCGRSSSTARATPGRASRSRPARACGGWRTSWAMPRPR